MQAPGPALPIYPQRLYFKIFDCQLSHSWHVLQALENSEHSLGYGIAPNYPTNLSGSTEQRIISCSLFMSTASWCAGVRRRVGSFSPLRNPSCWKLHYLEMRPHGFL